MATVAKRATTGASPEPETPQRTNAPATTSASKVGEPTVDVDAAETLEAATSTASAMPTRIIILRILVVIMFGLLAGLLGYYVYRITYDAQLRQFEAIYGAAVAQLDTNLQTNLNSKVTAATSTGSFFRFGLSNGNTTYGYFADFESFGSQQAALTTVRGVNYAPCITPATRPAFELYSRTNVGLLGITDNATLGNIQRGIYRRVNGLISFFPPNASVAFYLPVSQIAPIATNQFALNFDLYSEPNRKVAIDLALKTRTAACTDIIQLVQDTAIGVSRASGLMVIPVYSGNEASASTGASSTSAAEAVLPASTNGTAYADGNSSATPLVNSSLGLSSNQSSASSSPRFLGVGTAIFSWDDVLRQSLPSTAPVWALLTSSGKRTFSFYFNGSAVTNLGNGDFVAGNVSSHLLSYGRSVMGVVGLSFTFTVYPSDDLWTQYMTTLPRDLCIAVVAGIVAVALVSALYDYLASGRSKALDRIARAANRVLEDARLISRAHDFAEELREMDAINQIAGIANKVAMKPRELERELVTTLEMIGTGAFGKVYKGLLREKTALGSPSYLVAVKAFEKPSELDMRQIYMEALVMNQIKHRHILSLIGVVTRDRPVYLLLEYCEQGSLEKVLRENTNLFNASRLLMAHDVASGMLALHTMRLVHRDLAARNVLVDSSFRCKVSDFGLARRVSSSEYYESTVGRVAIRWVAPEALAQKKFSEMSDVWSFGVLLWEIWSSGAVPYGDWSNQRVWLEISGGYRMSAPTGCPANLYAIMRQCWVEQPHSRPTFSDLLGDFVRLLNGDTSALQRDLKEAHKQRSSAAVGLTTTSAASNSLGSTGGPATTSATWSIDSNGDATKPGHDSGKDSESKSARAEETTQAAVDIAHASSVPADDTILHLSAHGYVVEDELSKGGKSAKPADETGAKKQLDFKAIVNEEPSLSANGYVIEDELHAGADAKPAQRQRPMVQQNDYVAPSDLSSGLSEDVPMCGGAGRQTPKLSHLGYVVEDELKAGCEERGSARSGSGVMPAKGVHVLAGMGSAGVTESLV